jgi:hypothetical protein
MRRQLVKVKHHRNVYRRAAGYTQPTLNRVPAVHCAGRLLAIASVHPKACCEPYKSLARLLLPDPIHASTARVQLRCALAGNRIKITLALRSNATPVGRGGGWALRAWSQSMQTVSKQHTHPLPSGTFSRIFSTSSCFKMWRAIEPEPLADFSGRVPRLLRPPNTFLKAPTPAPPRMYTRRAIAAARTGQGTMCQHMNPGDAQHTGVAHTSSQRHVACPARRGNRVHVSLKCCCTPARM